MSRMWGVLRRLNRALDRGRRLDPDEVPTLTPSQALMWGLSVFVGGLALLFLLDSLVVAIGLSDGWLFPAGGFGLLYALTWVDRRSARRGSRGTP